VFQLTIVPRKTTHTLLRYIPVLLSNRYQSNDC